MIDCAPRHGNAASERTATFQERWRRPLLLLMGVELILLFAPTVVWLVDRWTISVWQNVHGIFIPPLSLWLARAELRKHRHLPVEGSRAGFAFLLPALALHAVDAGLHTQLLSAVALFLALPGLALLLLGSRRTRAIAFPLAFLVFAIPIPLVLAEPLNLLLRQIAANATADILPRVGIVALLDGTTIQTPRGGVIVGDGCSGFSTLYAAMAVACLVAYTATSRWRRAVVLLAAAPVAIASNVLRVVALTLMVTSGGGWLLDTFVHPLSGMLTFALTLPLIFWLGGPAHQST
jgi:exosortase